jgi:hypothetical protein
LSLVLKSLHASNSLPWRGGEIPVESELFSVML